MPRTPVPEKQQGFTLLEVLVATFIFAVAVAALLKVLGESANNLAYLEKKQFAALTAHNQMALSTLESIGSGGQVSNGGFTFNWSLVKYPTPDSRIAHLTLSISEPDQPQVLSRLNAFRENTP
ncbi:MAG: type II secretion system minor pseudopilin GspI [Pontibacterium sp.]